MNKKQVEILAPAGSIQALKAAVHAKADAVYIGGSRFGARAFAENPSEEELLKAMDYAHLYGTKVYLTVNTLLKQEEIEQDLLLYLKPYYEQGLDAVIVQDLGAMHLIHTYYPDLPIHASTQMTLTSCEGANFLKEFGVTRFVPARELSLPEIRKMRLDTNLEIETFVHGALCYSYSGQCLLSSVIGGRSGNRGRCAQPCRMKYTLEGSKNGRYLLSPKDICTLSLIPDLIEAGIDSFKIEGRMKRPEYTALCTYLYQKYTQLYYEHKRDGLEEYIARNKGQYEKEQQALMDMYNRGGFGDGYFQNFVKSDMMSMDCPSHYGVLVGTVIWVDKKSVQILLKKEIYPQDVLEIRSSNMQPLYDYTVGQAQKCGTVISANYKKGCKIEKNNLVFRTKNEQLLHKIKETFIDHPEKIRITGRFYLEAGQESSLCVQYKEVSAVAKGEMADFAKSRPLDETQIKETLSKLGDTLYEWESLTGEVIGQVFFPVGRLKELRRKAFAALEEKLLSVQRRKTKEIYMEPMEKGTNKKHIKPEGSLLFSASVIHPDQLNAVLSQTDIKRVYLALEDFTKQERLDGVKKVKEEGKELYLALPYIFRSKTMEAYLIDHMECFDGMLIRNYEELAWFAKFDGKYTGILDTNLYTYNTYAREAFGKLLADLYTLPLELTKEELSKRGLYNDTMVIYGHQPLMISEQCLQKNTNKCIHKSGFQKLFDRMGKLYYVRNQCEYCLNIIYDGEPLTMRKESDTIKKQGITSVRLDFTVESGDETKRIIKQYIQAFRGKLKTEKAFDSAKPANLCHYRKGVE